MTHGKTTKNKEEDEVFFSPTIGSSEVTNYHREVTIHHPTKGVGGLPHPPTEEGGGVAPLSLHPLTKGMGRPIHECPLVA